MCVSRAWRWISHSKKPKSILSGTRRFHFLAARPSSSSSGISSGISSGEPSGRRIGSSIGRFRLVAVQRLTEKADSSSGPKKTPDQSLFSLSKRESTTAADSSFEPPESTPVWEGGSEQQQRQSGGLRYVSAGITAAALLLGAGLVAQNDDVWVPSLEDTAAEFGKVVVATIRSISTAVRNSMVEVVDAGATALVLLQSLVAVLESYGEGVSKGWWRAKVAAFIADVSAAGGDRRKAVVCASDGAVIDWLLETAGKSQGPGSVATQGEAARALSYLLEDEATCESVLARPHALPYLLRFSAAIPANMKPQTYKQRKKLADIGSSRGKSQLVAAIMEIVTASCEPPLDGHDFRPGLPGTADPTDIAAALAVVEEGGLHLDDDPKDDGNDRGSLRGIGMKLVGGTGVVALQRQEHFLERLVRNIQDSLGPDSGSFRLALVGKDQDQDWVGYGLWDDLQGRLVAVPLAAWALATWAESSSANRSHISRLDKDGQALLAAVLAPERTVKWHGAETMRSLLENKKVQSDEVVLLWSSALLDMAVQACDHQDSALADSALSAFTACFKEGKPFQMSTFEKAFPVMRELSKQTRDVLSIQKSLARALDVAMDNGLRLHSDESKKWAGTLLRWLCSPFPDKAMQVPASSILGKVVEKLGMSSIPVCQALLASLLLDLIKHAKSPAAIRKEARAKGLLQSQLMQSALLAATQLGKTISIEARAEVAIADFAAELPLADLLGGDIVPSLPPKNGKELAPRISVPEAAAVVIKALKALTDISAEDQMFQKRVIEAGGLILLRRLMLADDYEEWCFLDASAEKDLRSQALKDKEAAEVRELASHMRKHAARLLTVLTQHPEVSRVVASDHEWCLWLEDCADGRIAGCNDLKSRSFAQMTLHNIAHSEVRNARGFGKDLVEGVWPRYEDMVFLLNFDTKFWKKQDGGSGGEAEEISAARGSAPLQSGDMLSPLMDVVFIHGLAGGPIKTWRVADDKTSTSGGLIERIDEQAGREGTCWPSEWLSHDLSRTRLLSLKYKTNFSEWSGATLPLEEVSSMLLDKLIAAGVGERPVVFISHSMGGLVVKQMLLQASKDKSRSHLLDQAAGVVRVLQLPALRQ